MNVNMRLRNGHVPLRSASLVKVVNVPTHPDYRESTLTDYRKPTLKDHLLDALGAMSWTFPFIGAACGWMIGQIFFG